MNLPNFLIIGAMKSGSTTVYRDLERHPDVFFPMDKEPANLCHDEVLTPDGRLRYASLFKNAKTTALGEASTDYTKIPDHQGVPQRARQILGEQLRLIYIVRDPIARLISHHNHDGAEGLLPEDPAKAIESAPGLVAYSRYAMQLAPWIDTFGTDAIRVLKLENYTADRLRHHHALCKHINVDPAKASIDARRSFNTSAGKPVPTGPWRQLIHSDLYRRTVRPLLPLGVRDRLRSALLPRSRFRAAPLSNEMIEQLIPIFEQDQRQFVELLGPDAPTWNLPERWLKQANNIGHTNA